MTISTYFDTLDRI
ncbi:hypothetical protein F383_10768 [Gossypium arboreum]|uniref:Uncharacterized protein n=1 Tax=Gossypium arboreum TaxID=29729 RepID=A0A0B0MJ63_GOSAR|nr:hypothetical protein F383_39094 [Gossypium arboreum]KHG16884.1 hypothetical protein F383_10768 [Gossypium arboreum]